MTVYVMLGPHLLEMFLALHFTNRIHSTILFFRTLSVSLATNGQFTYGWALPMIFEMSDSTIHRINYYPLETSYAIHWMEIYLVDIALA